MRKGNTMNKIESLKDTIKVYKRALSECQDDTNVIRYYLNKINQLTRTLKRIRKARYD